MSDETFDGYLGRWREADPQRALVWLFLRPGERRRFGALAALQQEWLKAVHDISEPQVATVKLGWWREEVERAAHGEARHPLTQVLFADPRVRAVSVSRWTAAVDSALLAIGTPPAPDLAAQCAATRPLATAFAGLETAVWLGPGTESPRAQAVAVFARLIGNLRALTGEVGHGRSPLPMNLLARHGLTIEGLVADSGERQAALRDYATGLAAGLADAVTMAGPLTLFTAAWVQRDLPALKRAARADDPLAALCTSGHGLRGLLKIWRAARTWRGVPYTETTA